MMKKLICLMTLYVFISWIQVRAEDITMCFEDGSWIVEEASKLEVKSNEATTCQLMMNGRIIQEIKKEDWIETEDGFLFCYEVKNPGWYILLDSENKFLGEAVYYQGEMLVTSHEVEYVKKDDWLLINQPTTLFFLEKEENNAFEGLEYEVKDGWHIYKQEITQEGTTELFKGSVKVWLDQTKPTVKMEILTDLELLEISKNEFLTNNINTKVQILKQDNSDELFGDKEGWIKTDDGYFLEYTLKEGKNDLTPFLSDAAGNLGNEPCVLYLDTKAPMINLEAQEQFYFNHPFDVIFQDDFLDWDASLVMMDGKDMKENCQKKGNSYSLKASQSGTWYFELVDLLGQKTIIQQEFVYDDVLPSYQTEIKDSQLQIAIIEENLAEVNLVLSFNGEQILGEMNENQMSFSLENDGIYELKGKIQDKAGNELLVDENLNVNVVAPRIRCQYLEIVPYLEPQTITCSIYDMYLKYWEVNLYRNDILLSTNSGTQNESINLVLDDTNYLDGQGVYRLEILGDDGVFQSHLEKEWVMDMGCAPIDLLINDVNGSEVKNLTILNPTRIQASCLEGDVYWELYQDYELIESGNFEEMTILPERKITSLLLQCEDALGHQQSKTIYFEYEPLPVVDFVKKIEVEKKETQPTVSKSLSMPLTSKVIGKQVEKSAWWIGGLAGAIGLMGCVYIWRLRHRKVESDLLDAKTTAIKD